MLFYDDIDTILAYQTIKEIISNEEI